ncbi:hypothetical protein [Thermoanaerobacterium sp. RBIITD]|jgi:hypothetical protein|uniref:hypothetical protein n=1 Tax=Thermoanaerobacterium sp. RBIITD TaxID=1550240 RepID=UPI000BB70460|nr:hypothetical protein [Thermoanaerobacterium sp. RBIITD]SNX54144.1 hypothetical protein SAMN05660242_1777 [Thermoanaerobacterium sp. RBIITD]
MRKKYTFYDSKDKNSDLNIVKKFGIEKCCEVMSLYYAEHQIEDIARDLDLSEDQVLLIITSHMAAFEGERAEKDVEAYSTLYDGVKSFLDGEETLTDLKKLLKESRDLLDPCDGWDDKDEN